MNKELVFRIINSKDDMYESCENMEQLYDNFYQPLLIEYENISDKYITQLNTIIELKRNQNSVLQQENKQLKDNWNKLKDFLKNTRKENLEWDKKHNCEWKGYNAYSELLIKMQELEQGSEK